MSVSTGGVRPPVVPALASARAAAPIVALAEAVARPAKSAGWKGLRSSEKAAVIVYTTLLLARAAFLLAPSPTGRAT